MSAIDPDLDADLELKNLTITGPVSAERASGPNRIGEKFCNTLEAITQEVSTYRLNNVSYNNQSIYLVDSPGFSDSKISESSIILMLQRWLKQNKGRFFNRILYCLPMRTRMPGSQRAMIRTVKVMLSPQFARRVAVVSTLWDTIIFQEQARQRAEALFKNLATYFWKDFVAQGTQMLKFYNTKNSTLSIIDHVVPGDSKGFFPFESMVINGQDLGNTLFAHHLRENLVNRIQGLESHWAYLMIQREENWDNEDIVCVLRRDLIDVDQQLDKLKEELRKFDTPGVYAGELLYPSCSPHRLILSKGYQCLKSVKLMEEIGSSGSSVHIEGVETASTSSLEPVLPPELERLIFECAAYDAKANFVDLMLVAKRVHTWLKHIPFLVFVQLDSETSPDFHRADNAFNLAVVGKYCRNLLTEEAFPGSESSETDKEGEEGNKDEQSEKTASEDSILMRTNPKTVHLLKSCPNVGNLALWFGFPITNYLTYIEPMPLHTLSADLSSLTVTQLSSSPLFPRLTHLDVVDFSNIDNWTFLENWYNLTHLAFNFEVQKEMIVQVMKAAGTKLKAFILVRNQVNWTHMDPDELDNGDPRLVLMVIAGRAVVEDWKEGAQGNMDFWAFGDWVVEAKQSECLNIFYL
ncbi:hypothetical protein CVT24_008995 [Panaeolus cyanescens]|uniref:G domain-containing protein n=1 Tax=Panaeolus cyanescens TaxID=181874 RepID=A0A409YAS3_9AGAR|nr:hypothetical protein CVT24_008995 [Panaeolus cyanescens]